MEEKFLNNEFYNHVKECVKEALPLVEEFSKNNYIGGYSHFSSPFVWYRIGKYENKMPDFKCDFEIKPIDYTQVFFSLTPTKTIKCDKLDSFINLLKYAKKNDRLKEFFKDIHYKDKKPKEISDYFLFYFPIDLIDRYIHIYNTFEFREENLKKLYLPLEKWIFSDKLNIEICIPILFTKFRANKYLISDLYTIEKMDDNFQLARYEDKDHQFVNHIVSGCATHCFKITGWYYEGFKNYFDFQPRYPLKDNEKIMSIIENFFSALRIYSDNLFGYAQIIEKKSDWVKGYTYTFPDITTDTIRKYPRKFDDSFWNKKHLPTYSKNDIDTISTIFELLNNTNNKRLQLAIKRFNLSFLRDNEEDSILDATICLEALFSDESYQEITHKLASRTTTILQMGNPLKRKPIDIYMNIKKIYDYRSKIVHGVQIKKKDRYIDVDGKEILKKDLLLYYIRISIFTLLFNNKYFDLKKIDNDLLLTIPEIKTNN